MLALLRLILLLVRWVIHTVVGLIVATLMPFIFLTVVLIVVDDNRRVFSAVAAAWDMVDGLNRRRRAEPSDSDDDLDPSQF